MAGWCRGAPGWWCGAPRSRSRSANGEARKLPTSPVRLCGLVDNLDQFCEATLASASIPSDPVIAGTWASKC